MVYLISTRDIARALGVTVQKVYSLLSELDTVHGIDIPKIGHRIVWNDDLIIALEDLLLAKGMIGQRILSARFLEKAGLE